MKELTENAPTDQSLCLSCGICCDGTLFDSVPLQPDDNLVLLKKNEIKILSAREKNVLVQPCAAHHKNCCQIYNSRPANCRSFRCKVLKTFDSGKISCESARQKIEHALKLRQSLEEYLITLFPAKNIPVSLVTAKKMIPADSDIISDPAMSKKWSDAMICLGILLDFLESEFRVPEKEVKTFQDS